MKTKALGMLFLGVKALPQCLWSVEVKGYECIVGNVTGNERSFFSVTVVKALKAPCNKYHFGIGTQGPGSEQ